MTIVKTLEMKKTSYGYLAKISIGGNGDLVEVRAALLEHENIAVKDD